MAKETITCPGGETIEVLSDVNAKIPVYSNESYKSIANGGPCVVVNALSRNSIENEPVTTKAHCGKCANYVEVKVSPKKSN